MKAKITAALIVAAILGQAAIGHSRTNVYVQGGGYGGGYGDDYGHRHGDYDRGVANGMFSSTALLGGLSTLDSVLNGPYQMNLVQTENEALNYQAGNKVSPEFTALKNHFSEEKNKNLRPEINQYLTKVNEKLAKEGQPKYDLIRADNRNLSNEEVAEQIILMNQIQR